MHRRKFMRGAALLSSVGLIPQLLQGQSLQHEKKGFAFDTPNNRSVTAGMPLTDAEALDWAKLNIASVRQPRIELFLTDRKGKPLAGLKVKVTQTQSEFLFGDNNYSMDHHAQNGTWDSLKAEAGREVFAGLFNTINNTCYWTEKSANSMKRVEEHQGDIRLESFAKVVDWAVSNGITCKGHPLFWPVDKAIPKWLRHYDYDTQLKFLEVRVRSMVSRFKSKVPIWDMVNEMMWEPALVNINKRNWPHLESEENLVAYISMILRWAKEEDPTGTFLLNEYGVENDEKVGLKDQFGTPVTAASQRKRYISLIQALQKAGTPVDGIGLQSHSGRMLTPLEQYKIYQEFGVTGLPIHITEFWVQSDHGHEPDEQTRHDPAKQDQIANKIVDYVTMAYGHQGVDAFMGWGLTKHCYQIDNDGSYDLFASYHRLKDLTQKQWRTNLEAKTDNNGKLSFNGFEGSYQLTFTDGKIRKGIRFDHKKGINQQHLSLPITT